ncbi:RAP domain-containing protein [Endozoicomonas acroporae]|uniref:RAP domain-containing protein n=1 Tax=Endozoicomonas acroporae TaxID=1701104 RepID=UPI0013D73E57|nr:RAP domain-containing protein [Endozoicomonas acroporae]
MDRSSAGISGQYARSGNDDNQPNDHASSSRRGRHRHASVKQWDITPRTTPKRNEFYHSTVACPSQYLLRRSVNPAQNFNDLTKQEIMAGLVIKSDRFGHHYDGRDHGLYASTIKKYTSASNRPLNRAEQSQLMRLLQNFAATRSWNWRSLTTTLHSFTSAGVFTLHKPIDARVKLTQANVLSTLFDAIIFNCNQKPEARDIDAQGIANLLWAMAKLVDNGHESTPAFNEAVAALLHHVNAQKDQFNARDIANLLWAMAKLIDNRQESTPELNEAVAALLPHVNAQRASFKPQGIANLLWAMAKLVDNGQESTPELNEAVAALLPLVSLQKYQLNTHGIANLLWAIAKLVDNGLKRTPGLKEALAALLPLLNAQKNRLTAQGIANLLWAMAKLVDNGLERTPGFKEAVAALLPLVNAQKDQFIPQGIANLLWAMTKLVDNGQDQTPELKEAVAALLPHVNSQKACFKPQEIANLLWTMAKLVDNGQEQTPGLKEAVVALLPLVNAQKDQFTAQGIVNLLWAMAKLVDNGQKSTPELNEAVSALLPQVNAQRATFKPQDITNLLWAMTKLLDNGQEQTPALNEAVAMLLPHVNAQKDQFTPQHIANLLWAMAKLVDNGQEWTPDFKAALAALLPHVSAQKANFKPQGIANLLWAMAKLGELVDLNVVTSTFKSLVHKISENPQFSQQDMFMSLWGVMVCCARLSLVPNANKNNVLEKHLDDLFTRLKNTPPDNAKDQRVIAMAASWLGRPCPIVPHYQTTISKPQSDFRNQLQSCMPSLKIEEEKSLNSLPPVDLLLPDHNMVIEIQGPFHYVSNDFKTRNGSTLLKIALLQKSGFEVIEIPINTLWSPDSIKRCIDQIKTRIPPPPKGHGSESFNNPE